MSLFQIADFTLASGRKSNWKIECDALTADDWSGLAAIANEVYGFRFGQVVGVPRGGLPFAWAMEEYADPESKVVLVVDDVLTTGGSITRVLDQYPGAHGLVAFARGRLIPRVSALFVIPPLAS